MTLALQGEQVYLRPFEMEDVDALQAYLNHPGLAGQRYLPHGFSEDIPLSSGQTRDVIGQWGNTNNRVHLAVMLRTSEQLIGHAAAYWGWDAHCPGAELVIAPAQQRRKLGSEAFRLLVQWVFDVMPAHNVGVEVADWNVPAQKFLEKHGFQESGRSRREGMRNGKFYDLVLFDILRREWQRR